MSGGLISRISIVCIISIISMNLLENKNHKRGEYTLKSKIGVEKFNCTTLPTEKKHSLGNLVKTSLTFGNETRRFCQNLKSFVLCNEYPFIGIRCLMTMEQIEASWRLLRPLHWLPDTSHRPPPLQLKLSNNFCYGFWGGFFVCFYLFFLQAQSPPWVWGRFTACRTDLTLHMEVHMHNLLVWESFRMKGSASVKLRGMLHHHSLHRGGCSSV